MSSQRPSLIDDGDFGSIGSGKKGSSGGGLTPEKKKMLIGGLCISAAVGFLGYQFVYVPWARNAKIQAERDPAKEAQMEKEYEQQQKEYDQMKLEKQIEQGEA